MQTQPFHLTRMTSPPQLPVSSALYHILYTIRRFEETVLDNFPKGVFFGTTHTYLGQEADAVGVLSNLLEGDVVFSNHRCHGHFLAYGGPALLRPLFAELMGKAAGVCGGRGGSQHLQWKNFYSNGVQGGIAPVATGMALAEKLKASGAIAINFLGDGTLGEGALYEALNLAALWSIPILYVMEDNHIAQTTPSELGVAGDILARFQAFGIPARQLDSSDVLEIMPLAGELLAEVRTHQAPRALVLHTCRFGPHSKGDDTRPAEMVDRMRQQRDPLAIQAARLLAQERAAVEMQVDAAVTQAFQQALEDPFPALDTPTAPVFAAVKPAHSPAASASVLASLNAALRQALDSDPAVYLLGEDLLDPYGGAFKMTRGLSTAFPGRVLTTPISEAGFTGLATGMALRGLRPVVEIMFGDFVTLLADQLINHAAKFRWMYNGNKSPAEQVRIPLVIRTPMGGRRGYGPTHSQTLEKLFLGVPGLRLLAPSALGDPGGLLLAAILNTADPVLFIENKLLYLLPVQEPASLEEFDVAVTNSVLSPAAPAYTLALRGAPPAGLTLAAYGYMAELARQAVIRLAYEHEVFVELVILTQLAPFDLGVVLASARRTHRLVAVEEGTLSLGWGAEVLAQASEALGGQLQSAVRLAGRDLPIPSSGPLEAAVLPGVEEIMQTCLEIAQKGAI